MPDNKKKCSCPYSPLIILPGINHSPVYVYNEDGSPRLDKAGNPIGDTLLIPDKDYAKDNLPELIKKILVSSFIPGKSDPVKDVYEYAKGIFAFQKCGKDGCFVENLKVKRWDYPISGVTEEERGWVYRMVPMECCSEVIGEDHIYFFTFNLVGDPMETAKELHDYIELVKEQTGHDKVSLLPVSLGGTILTAYLDSYGTDDLDRIVNVVACLDGTDIAGDLFARNFNVSAEYLHHRFLADVFKEEKGTGTVGYTLNSLMHLLPEKSFNALLTGFITALLDEVIINCPETWAMLPSYRYEELKERYLTGDEYETLRRKTDRFQQARLNLKDNILKAKKNGVKIDFISGSNLAFGEKEYSFFGAVGTAYDYNTDGIINLSSATLGATGTKNGEKLPDDYVQAKNCKGKKLYSYISPDRRIDVSTAVLPDNTWIFLDQHHEVGKNDVVLNLARDIITGKVKSVHTNPDKYPQFNGTCNTKDLHRWLIRDGERAEEGIKNRTIKAAPSNIKELSDAVENAKQVLKMTVADDEKVKSAEERLRKILVRLEQAEPEKPVPEREKAAEKITEAISEFLVKTLGGGNIADKILGR